MECLPATDAFELIIVPVKHYGLVRTLAEIVPRSGDAGFLLLTQNWRGIKELDAILPSTRYIYGDAKAGGSFSGVTLAGALKSIDIGSAEGESSPLVAKVASLFASAHIPATLHSNMLHYLWVQYAITGGLWGALIQAGSFDAMLKDQDAALAAFNAARECLEVVRRRGVDVSRYGEAKPFLTDFALLRRFFIWLTMRMFRRDEYTKRCSAHAFNDPLEVKTFYDDLMETGQQLGVLMPVMASFSQQIQRLEMRAVRTPSSSF